MNSMGFFFKKCTYADFNYKYQTRKIVRAVLNHRTGNNKSEKRKFDFGCGRDVLQETRLFHQSGEVTSVPHQFEIN